MRRSLWVRLGEDKTIELCAGREGDDEYVLIPPENPCNYALYEVLEAQLWAIEIDGVDPDLLPVCTAEVDRGCAGSGEAFCNSPRVDRHAGGEDYAEAP